MRLICPNCGAQYEVPDDVIPAEGRDVQCSSCSHTWFERPGESVAAEDSVLAATAASTVTVADAVQDMSADVAPPAPKPSPVYTGKIEDAFADILPDQAPPDLPDTSSEFEMAEGETAPTTAPQRRTVEPAVATILQEEAAREAAVRQAEAATGLEAQPDLGLQGHAPEQSQTPPHRARPDAVPDATTGARPAPEEQANDAPKGHTAAAPAAAAAVAVAAVASTAGSRRELLPDIEEINSSLRSNAERGEDKIPTPEEVGTKKRRGFRTGFLLILILLGILTALYIFAPQIAAAVPSAADLLDQYVAAVDAGRIWLDIKAKELLRLIQPTAEQ